jgi:hypothetical protein
LQRKYGTVPELLCWSSVPEELEEGRRKRGGKGECDKKMGSLRGEYGGEKSGEKDNRRNEEGW